MDTSKEYVLMCDKAKEIQKLWKHSKRNSGDWYFHKELNCAYVVTDIEQNNSDCIWLPRQDQLQEMVLILCNFPCQVLSFLDTWIDKNNIKKSSFRSMEHLFISFVMKWNWNKVWNGRCWIKEENE